MIGLVSMFLLACGQTGALYQPNQAPPSSNQQTPAVAIENNASAGKESVSDRMERADNAARDDEQENPDEL